MYRAQDQDPDSVTYLWCRLQSYPTPETVVCALMPLDLMTSSAAARG